MMTISQISLILFVAVTFGAAQDVASDTEEGISICYYTNFVGDSNCFDYDAVEKCVNQITPHNDEDRESVTGNLEYLKERKTACPAFKNKSTCIATELRACLQDFIDFKKKKEKEACNVISKARACLINFNNTCNANVIEYEYEALEEVNVQCSSGHWDDGECSPKHVFNCTASFFNDFANNRAATCKTAGDMKAKKCLSDYKAKCTTKDQQKEVDYEFNDVNFYCPSE